MECKKCGMDLSGREYRTVAQWSFCPACFEALMEKVETKPKEEAGAPVPGPVLEKQTCLVCERDLEKGEGRELLGLVFCLQCYENLISKPAIPSRPDTGDQDAQRGPMEKQAVEQTRVDFSRTVACSGCGKKIPAMGSKLFNDNPYCPDCYYRLPEKETQKPQPANSDTSGPQSPEQKKDGGTEGYEGVMTCQACRRPVLRENLKTVDGFEICLACLTVDPEAALAIARARHRRILEQIRKELDV